MLGILIGIGETRDERLDAPLVLEQRLEDADRGVERRARRAALGLAVPAAVGELLADQPLREAAAGRTEHRSLREHLPVAQEHELVAALRLVHHVARDEQREAIGRELAEGDEILITRLDHDADRAPWLAAIRAAAEDDVEAAIRELLAQRIGI